MGQQHGNQNICQNITKFSNNSPEDLVFYMTVQDPQFGTISVYTSTKRPSSYVAKVQKTVENSKIYNIFQQVENNQLASLASLHAFQLRREKYCTGKIQQKVTAYWEYFNYSFDDFLKMRFLKRVPFSEKEMWLIVKACCQSFSLMNFHHLVLDLDLKHIMVVPEGKIKIFWHHLEHNKSHLKYYQKINQLVHIKKSSQESYENRSFWAYDKKEEDLFYFSPQQIEGIQKRQETLKMDFTRANSFRLGMILLYCVTLTNPIKTCYGINNVTGQRRIKLMVLNSLYESKIENSTKYSDDLKHLIKLLLLEDPNKRIPLDRLQTVYEKFICLDTELSMGRNEKPLCTPSSSRKNLKEQPKRDSLGFNQNIKLESSNLATQNKSQYKQKNNSEQIIQESQVKSCGNKYEKENRNSSSLNYNQQEAFDKFDTKTIKISSTYNHKK